jgi:hypothetical protein
MTLNMLTKLSTQLRLEAQIAREAMLAPTRKRAYKAEIRAKQQT